MADFFGMGIIVEDFKPDGIEACVRERLKRFARTPESWSAHPSSTVPGMPSGPAAFRVFTVLSTRLTSCSWTVSGGASVASREAPLFLRVYIAVFQVTCHSLPYKN